MKEIKSVLEFKNYIVNEIVYKINKKFNKDGETASVDLNIEPQIEINGNDMEINLITMICEKAEENNYPFEMKIDITGKFSVCGENPQKFQANAIAILYPYIRSIVSTYTAAANISPLILPAINVNAMIEAKNNEK